MMPTARGTLRISIHALREEGDHGREDVCHFRPNFYPRPPRGGRREGQAPEVEKAEFLSTPSARRATFSGQTTTL